MQDLSLTTDLGELAVLVDLGHLGDYDNLDWFNSAEQAIILLLPHRCAYLNSCLST